MLKKITLSRGSWAALEGSPCMGQGQPEDLAFLNPLLKPTETQAGDKKFCQLNNCCLLLPHTHFEEENVPGAFFGCL